MLLGHQLDENLDHDRRLVAPASYWNGRRKTRRIEIEIANLCQQTELCRDSTRDALLRDPHRSEFGQPSQFSRNGAEEGIFVHPELRQRVHVAKCGRNTRASEINPRIAIAQIEQKVCLESGPFSGV